MRQFTRRRYHNSPNAGSGVAVDAGCGASKCSHDREKIRERFPCSGGCYCSKISRLNRLSETRPKDVRNAYTPPVISVYHVPVYQWEW